MTSQKQPPKVLIVEDHVLIARYTAKLVKKIGCEVVGPVGSTAMAIRLAEVEQPNVALVDLSLSDGCGEDLIEKLQELGVACAICTGAARPPNPPDAIANLPWLEKPVSIEQLQTLMSTHGQPSTKGA